MKTNILISIISVLLISMNANAQRTKEEFMKIVHESAEGDAVAQYQLGDMYYNGTDGLPVSYKDAAEWYSKSAEQGNAFAQLSLGFCYYTGNGVEQSYSKAFEWWMKSAAQNNSEAQFNIATCYHFGQGVDQSDSQCLTWTRKAALNGNLPAQLAMASTYENGEGVAASQEEAMKWYKMAAEQGDAEAEFQLGWYLTGQQDGDENMSEAFNWFMKAAVQGHSEAQRCTAEHYANGWGVEQSYTEAKKWFQKAIAQGNENAKEGLELYASDIEKEELAKNASKGSEQEPFSTTLTKEALTQKAEAGDAKSQYLLSLRSDITRNKIVEWCRKSAEQGYVYAQRRLGEIYETGEGVNASLSDAKKWYEKAAAQGDAIAKENLNFINDIISKTAYLNEKAYEDPQKYNALQKVVIREAKKFEIGGKRYNCIFASKLSSSEEKKDVFSIYIIPSDCSIFASDEYFPKVINLVYHNLNDDTKSFCGVSVKYKIPLNLETYTSTRYEEIRIADDIAQRIEDLRGDCTEWENNTTVGLIETNSPVLFSSKEE